MPGWRSGWTGFPICKGWHCRIVAGRNPNDLTLSFLITDVAVCDDKTGAEAPSASQFEDPVRRVNLVKGCAANIPCLTEPTVVH